jgi:hypothetical protein
MKKYVTKQEDLTFSDGDVVEDLFYGVEGTGRKGFIIFDGFGEGDFVAKSFETINNGHGYIYREGNLGALIKILHTKKLTVFQFGSYQELLLWGAK